MLKTITKAKLDDVVKTGWTLGDVVFHNKKRKEKIRSFHEDSSDITSLIGDHDDGGTEVSQDESIFKTGISLNVQIFGNFWNNASTQLHEIYYTV